ncbi:MAG: hypothetical protein ACTHOD_04680 [Motilibacteraceae bacterium]
MPGGHVRTRATSRLGLLAQLLAMSVSLVLVPARHATGGTFMDRAYQVAVTRLGDPFRYSGKGPHAGGGYVIHANSGSYFGRKVIRERIAFYWAKYFSVEYRRVR